MQLTKNNFNSIKFYEHIKVFILNSLFFTCINLFFFHLNRGCKWACNAKKFISWFWLVSGTRWSTALLCYGCDDL